MDWINLPHDRDQWRAFVYTVMKLRFHKMLGNSSAVERLAASQERLGAAWSYTVGLYSVELERIRKEAIVV
jgi:hypothetical protein